MSHDFVFKQLFLKHRSDFSLMHKNYFQLKSVQGYSISIPLPSSIYVNSVTIADNR